MAFAWARKSSRPMRVSAGVLCLGGTGAYPIGNPGPGLGAIIAGHDFETFISLIQDIHAMKERSPAALRAVFERHESELVDE